MGLTDRPTTVASAAGIANNKIAGPPGSLEASDFVFERVKPKNQANVLIFGGEGQGKTTFATEFAPEPVAIINFDHRSGRAVDRAREHGRKIGLLEVEFSANVSRMETTEAQKLAQRVVNQVLKNFETAVAESRKGNVRSICIDTGSEYTEILNVAITGSQVGVKGDYGKSRELMNREWARMFGLAREGNAHLIVISRQKDVWENNAPTGETTYRGPAAMSELADWAGQIRVKKNTRAAGGIGGSVGGPVAANVQGAKEFELRITKAGNNIAELGAVYSQNDWEALGGPFVYACYMQYPGSSPEDWQ